MARTIRTAAACLLASIALFQGVSANDVYDRAIALMESSPLLDTHVDLPQILRSLDRRPLETIPQLKGKVAGHVDLPRIREGKLGGAFWTVWAPCPELVGEDPGKDFNTPTNGLRDSLEILDLIQNMISQLPDDLQYARSSDDVLAAFNNGKIASLIGMEGTHILGNSLSSLRVFAQLGVRYLTLTHTCHSAFASSNGDGSPISPSHEGNRLTALGEELVLELNRLGIMVDLSHTSDATAKQAIAISKAPVIWSHSGSRTMWDHPRNIPDDILRLVGDGPGQNPGVIQSVFYPPFIGPVDSANVSRVADHIEYIANIVGKKHVGIGSDFNGMYSSVEGLEDASKYPNLIVEMLERGWTDDETKDLMGRNLMRVMDAVDAIRDSMADNLPSTAVWEKRTDLPAVWGGKDDAYYPAGVLDAQKAFLAREHDEL
ncbi:related to Putative dipeptidase ARB_02715 [Cephalotrichum gorgonifer]|uniref:Dipeptidase n=1 Tax=Cephalotrichum gorgonifer TaxID=2041049 RepID=A0AAE8MUL3_9PEZI|nr:related to Putative dipeptidase ARB_02715 [Cephalotrichum gorgonifer]